jgi:hypothetical protein
MDKSFKYRLANEYNPNLHQLDWVVYNQQEKIKLSNDPRTRHFQIETLKANNLLLEPDEEIMMIRAQNLYGYVSLQEFYDQKERHQRKMLEAIQMSSPPLFSPF